MGKRKGRAENSETLIPNEEGGNDVRVLEEKEESNRFFACYLLTSLNPRFKGHTYIGFTVNPQRRIRQHNGEIRSGAWRTKSKRPWEMVFCIYGFPTNVSALQFEWAWQHPTESLAVRNAAASFKSFSGIANKIKLAYTMLNLPAWRSLNITVNYFSTKYTKHYACCPSLPEHMKMQVCSMDELPCYSQEDESFPDDADNWNDEDDCFDASRVSVSVEVTKDSSVDNFICLQKCIDKTGYVSSGWSAEYENLVGESHQPSRFVDQPVRMPSPVSTSHLLEIADLVNSSEANEGNSAELSADTPDKHALPSSSPIVSREVEIIDVFTPSPACRTSLSGKRRKASKVCPDVIDLTKSPIFVQL